ncbi:glutathione S-transferase family protein [Sphingomonas sp.]|uniref:glutathione S-transferase family protein n=1 Tax=Sphingomonas sp. TaxID=28214 RepID=UPI001ED3E5FA|nr:glutathione S-transferase family protein [Sphingomonas sp.]MBX3592845.1 glutathione S-transferase family protein [Sphingomonas sp.]
MSGDRPTPDLVLYFAPGACSGVTMIALEEIGVPFEARLVAFMAGEHRRPEFLARNPAGKVPTLMVDGQPLTQNPVILAWLARRFPQAGLLPLGGDAIADAQLLGRLSWFSADVHPLVTRIRMPQFMCDLPGAPERVRAMAGEAIRFHLAPLEQALAEAPWLLGDRWSVLDAYLFWVWFRITGAGFAAAEYPAIAAHYERMSDRPSVRRALVREDAAFAELSGRGLAVPLS